MSEQDPGTNAQLELLQRIGVRGFFMTNAYTYVLQGYTPGQYIFGFNLTTQETAALPFDTPIEACAPPRGVVIRKNIRRLGFN